MTTTIITTSTVFAMALVVIIGLIAVPVMMEAAEAKKGEVRQHISPKGTENQSTEGRINSGNLASTPLCKVGDPPPCEQFP